MNEGKDLDIVVCTNLACVTDDILLYFRDEGVKVSTSLDGPAFLHNKNRPRPGHNSYEKAIEGIERSRAILGMENVAALMTTTAASLDNAAEIVDEYVRRDFHSIFLRPISPYGFAVKTCHRTGYEMDRFLEFYKQGLAHILKVNRGGYRIAEVYTQILLTKILTPHSTRYVDMQSPAGEAWNVLVYNYDGDVYASDESRMLAEMRDWTFRLGNVHKDTRRTPLHRRSGAATVPGILQSGARGLFRLRIPVRIAPPILCTTTPPRATCTGIGPRAASVRATWKS